MANVLTNSLMPAPTPSVIPPPSGGVKYHSFYGVQSSSPVKVGNTNRGNRAAEIAAVNANSIWGGYCDIIFGAAVCHGPSTANADWDWTEPVWAMSQLAPGKRYAFLFQWEDFDNTNPNSCVPPFMQSDPVTYGSGQGGVGGFAQLAFGGGSVTWWHPAVQQVIINGVINLQSVTHWDTNKFFELITFSESSCGTTGTSDQNQANALAGWTNIHQGFCNAMPHTCVGSQLNDINPGGPASALAAQTAVKNMGCAATGPDVYGFAGGGGNPGNLTDGQKAYIGNSAGSTDLRGGIMPYIAMLQSPDSAHANSTADLLKACLVTMQAYQVWIAYLVDGSFLSQANVIPACNATPIPAGNFISPSAWAIRGGADKS